MTASLTDYVLFLNCTKTLNATNLWRQSAHSLGMEDLGSVLDGHVVALCLFILLFVLQLQDGMLNI